MKLRLASILSLACGAVMIMRADTIIVFNDLTSSPFVTIAGIPVAGNGGKISNFVSSNGGENISFSFTQGSPGNFLKNPLYGDLLDSPGGPVSDRWMVAPDPLHPTQYSITFASTPGGSIPALLPGAVQYSPPKVETGTSQLVGRVQVDPSDFDDFFIESSPTTGTTPEPGSILLSGTMLALAGVMLRSKLARTS